MKYRKIIFSLIFIFFLIFPVAANNILSPGLTKTAPYADIPVQRTPNWGGMDAEFIQAGHNDRIRQNGTIYQIRFAVADASKLTQFIFTIWRKNGTNYDRIATTDNLINNISNGINIIDLATPIEGVQEGDFYGYSIKSSADALYIDTNVTDHRTFYVSDSVTSSTNYNWTHQTNTTYVFVVEPFMDKPYMAFIGDSIISGFPEHLSFLQNEDVTDIQASIENKWSRKVDKSYQNMGFGGDTTGKLNSRFISDVVDLSPEFVLIEGGINDINAYPVIDYTTTLDNWESMIQKASNKKITPVIMLILPDSRATNERSDNISYMNEQLIKLANLYSPSIVVDARCHIGVQRASGPPGNCWDIDRKYTGDGLHYNSIGNERIAQAIKDSFRFVYGKEGLYNLIQPDGTIIYSTSLSDATNISLRMASTTGTANVSLNMPAAGEYANITIYSGTIGLINIDNLSPNQCDLLSSDSMNIETKVAMNGNIRFTKKLPSGTYSIRCNIPPAIIVWNSSRTNGKSLSLSVNVSENVNFSAIADQAITSWDWEYDGIYSVSRTNNDFTASWADPGLKTIRVFAENQNGTSNIITWEVNVTAKSNQTMNNPQDVNGSRGGSVNMSSSEKPGSGGSTLNALISSIVALPIKLKFLIVFFLLTIAIMFGDYVKSK